MTRDDRWSVIIRKSAVYDDVIVYFGDNFTHIDLSKVDMHKKRIFLTLLISWGLDGYKGNPPSLER